MRKGIGRSISAAKLVSKTGISVKKAANKYKVGVCSVYHAFKNHSIKYKSRKRDANGLAIRAFEYVRDIGISKDSASQLFGVSKCSINGAANRLGFSMVKLKPDRRLQNNRGLYYFRYRTKHLNLFIKLSRDLDEARLMRDKLETEYKIK